MKTRIMTSITLWVSIILSLAIFRAHAGVFILAFIAYFAQLELYQMFEKSGAKPMKQVGLICGAILMFGSFYFGDLSNDLFLITFLIITLLIIGLDVKNGNFNQLLPTLFGFIYIPYLLHFIFKIYHLNIQEGYSTDAGVFLCFWVVIIAINTDIGGYIFGKLFGKNKLSIISPKKTLEGAIGGIAFAMIVGLILMFTFNQLLPSQLTVWKALLIIIPLSVVSIGSDLIESAFKRQAGQKDSGNLIPGLGGIFDLSDSIILTAPLAYLLIKFFIF
jgi:phosphatidate cytidylyltransferase